jgi:hypothetical protein
LDGILILNKWMTPSGDGLVWVILWAACIIIAWIMLFADLMEWSIRAMVVGFLMLACFFVPFVNHWEYNYEVALNGATYEQLIEHYDVYKVNGNIFTVGDK